MYWLRSIVLLRLNALSSPCLQQKPRHAAHPAPNSESSAARCDALRGVSAYSLDVTDTTAGTASAGAGAGGA